MPLEQNGNINYKTQRERLKELALPMIGLLLCTIYSISALAWSGIVGFLMVLPGGENALLLPYPYRYALMLAIGPIIVFWTYRTAKNKRTTSGLIHVLFPLCFMPLPIYTLLCRRFIPQVAGGNILFYGLVLIISLIIYRAINTYQNKIDTIPLNKYTAFAVFIIITLLYTLLGCFFTKSIGAHSGDEGHYIIQAESLFFDRDLDIKNNLGTEPTPELRNKIHISPYSKGGHWFSWHPFGLSLLMAPTVPHGIWARHMVLGMISALACAGLVVLCKIIKVGSSWALLTLTLFSLSTYWGVYSSRALPEVLGAALMIWAAIAILIQKKWPISSMLLALLSCGYLPWAHTRFIPLSLFTAGIYGLRCLAGNKIWQNKLIMAGLWGVAICSAYGMYYYIHSLMFDGAMAYPTRKLLFSYPIGAWLTIASDRGILSVLPSFGVMLAANILVALRDREYRWHALTALSFTTIVLTTSSATIWFTGGSCLAGRFLLAVIPLLLPLTAKFVAKCSPTAKWWTVFLGVIPVMHFVLMLTNLENFGKAFVNPSGSIPKALPLFDGMIRPFLGVHTNPLHPFALSCLLGTFLIVAYRGKRNIMPLVLISLIVVGAITSASTRGSELSTTNPSGYQRILSRYNLEKSHFIIWPKPKTPAPLFSFSNMFAAQKYHDVTVSVTTEDLGARTRDYLVSQPRLDVNDWDNRGYRWTTLIGPFEPGRKGGLRAFRLKGKAHGSCVPILAIREGSVSLVEKSAPVGHNGEIDFTVTMKCHGKRGHIYLLLRLDGEGLYEGEFIQWSPFSNEMLGKVQLSL